MHDIAVIYRSGAKNDAGNLPAKGPSDLCHVVLATSDAFPLKDDPFAGAFATHHGCRIVFVAKFAPPIGLNELKANAILASWPALRASFVRSGMAMPQSVWDELLKLDRDRTRPRRTRDPPQRKARTATAAERRQVENILEDWLEDHVDALEPLLGFPVELVGRQLYCGDEHRGTIDLLLRRTHRKSSYVVAELKADEIRRDAVAQALGYLGWLRSQKNVKQVAGVVIGLEPHPQVPWVLDTIPGLVSVHHWNDLGLPDDVRAKVDWAALGS